jgi:hypothetical protein
MSIRVAASRAVQPRVATDLIKPKHLVRTRLFAVDSSALYWRLAFAELPTEYLVGATEA